MAKDTVAPITPTEQKASQVFLYGGKEAKLVDGKIINLDGSPVTFLSNVPKYFVATTLKYSDGVPVFVCMPRGKFTNIRGESQTQEIQPRGSEKLEDALRAADELRKSYSARCCGR
jgi:hypothetical protein